MLRSSASITVEEEAPMTQKGTEEPSKENPAEMLVANVVNYGEFSEDPFSEDSIIFSCPPPDVSVADAGNVERDPEEKHDDDPPSFLPISMDHASQGSWMGARPYDDEDVVPMQSPVPCGSPKGELAEPVAEPAAEPSAEPSAEPVADAFLDAVHEKVFELTQPEAGGGQTPAMAWELRSCQDRVLAPELPGTISEAAEQSTGEGLNGGLQQPEAPCTERDGTRARRRQLQADYSSTDVVASAAEEPGTGQEQSSQLEVPEPKDSDQHCPAQVVETTGSMDGASSAVQTDVATEAKPGVVKDSRSAADEEQCDGVTAESMTVDFEGYSRAEAASPEADAVDSTASAEQPGDLNQADSQEVAELREHILELQEAVASKDQTVAAQQQMLEGKSTDLKALEDQIALLQATVTDLKANIAEQPGNLQERLKAAECRESDQLSEIQSLQVELSRSASEKAASQQHWEEQVVELKRVVAEKDAEMTALRTSQLGRQEEDLTCDEVTVADLAGAPAPGITIPVEAPPADGKSKADETDLKIAGAGERIHARITEPRAMANIVQAQGSAPVPAPSLAVSGGSRLVAVVAGRTNPAAPTAPAGLDAVGPCCRYGAVGFARTRQLSADRVTIEPGPFPFTNANTQAGQNWPTATYPGQIASIAWSGSSFAKKLRVKCTKLFSKQWSYGFRSDNKCQRAFGLAACANGTRTPMASGGGDPVLEHGSSVAT
ncbi:rha-1 [Symbiodinium sp. CCMP2456]|nr:rha-1 [Symbiodinium sp. CCMP2456]